MSRLRSNHVESDRPLAIDRTVYVALRQQDGKWRAGSMDDRPRQSGLFLRGKIRNVQQGGPECPAPCRIYQVAYNLEQFFVPEGRGRALEQLRSDQRLEVDVAIAEDGRAALKRLVVDGTVQHEDSLF
jgi:uncharacterized membrane-anchored protein